ncbi:MAG: hypothetical protein U0572_06405 [Phycisphaerales bacterium]
MRRTMETSRRCGHSLLSTVIGCGCVAVLMATAIPVLGNIGTMSGEAVSLSNLRVIAEAHAAYASTFNERQVTWIPDDVGLVNGNCTTYVTEIACPPQLILGTDPINGAIWGYYLGGGLCAQFPGTCANFAVYKPFVFSGSWSNFGSFRLQNADAFNNFVDGRFYSDVWYSPNDESTYRSSAWVRDIAADFTAPPYEVTFSSYCLSPAAMFHPSVFGAAFGGYRNPDTFADAYVSPSVTQCAYPDLKTRSIEHNWNRSSPGISNPNFAGGLEPFYFNASSEACPLSLFFDGHIARLPNSQAIADDQALFEASGQRLWSRSTPLGSNGYFGAQMLDTSPKTSHTILTIDGILGRDILGPR